MNLKLERQKQTMGQQLILFQGNKNLGSKHKDQPHMKLFP
jgi:hypothetical protein